MTGRFAIYAAPGGLLRTQAERWLGRSVTGAPVTPAGPAGWTRAAVDEITVSARRYGFHATLKAPFRLAPGRTAEELDDALVRFAAGRERVLIPRLRLARLGGFFALVPDADSGRNADADADAGIGAGTGTDDGTGTGRDAGAGKNAGADQDADNDASGNDTAALYALADEVVTAFDRFRAPLTEAEIARRRPASLTPRQRELLKAWGYPYVLDEFLLHLTLTDRIPPDRQPEVEAALSDWFAPWLGATVPVDAIALFTEPEPGAPFTQQATYPLRPLNATGP